MKPTSLSLTERLILAQQSLILSFVDSEHREDHIFTAKVFEKGYVDFYDEAFTVINPEFGTDESDYVHRILGIYSDIQYSCENNLTEEERKEIGSITFPGFDGNDTQDYYRAGFARFCLEHSRYTSLKQYHSDFNSHRDVSEKYSGMIKRYEEIGSPRELTAAQIKYIVGR